MLDTSSENLLAEIRSAEKAREGHLRSLESQLDRYHGPAWKAGNYKWSELAYDPKNRGFQYVSQILPQVAYDNPRYAITSKRGPMQRMVATAMRHGMNRWAVDTDVQTVAEQVAVDAQFTYGVLCVVQAPSPITDPGFKEPLMRPQMYRLPQGEFGIDAVARDVRDARFMFHMFVIDKDDLVKMATDRPEDGWSVEVIEALTSDTGKERLVRAKNADEPTRDEIVGYSVWIPEEELPFGEAEMAKYGVGSWREGGFHGTVRTLAIGNKGSGDSEGGEIRVAQPYYGPPSGPYQIIGKHYVPNAPYPMGTLTACEAQNQELNVHARAELRSAARRKKIAVVGANDTLLANAVKSAQDGDVVSANVAEIKNNLVELEVGGPTEIQRLIILDLENDFDNAVGSSDASRGTVTGKATATENSIAAQASSGRSDWDRKKFRRQFAAASKKVAWYLYHDDRVAFPLGDEAGAELGIENPWFSGGTHGEESGATFEDLELDIEAASMKRVDEAEIKQTTLQLMQMVTSWFPLMAQFPEAGWVQMVDDLGDKFDVPSLAETVNVQAVVQSAAMMKAMMMMGGMGGQPGAPGMPGALPSGPAVPQPQPRLAGDSGLPRNAQGGMASGLKQAPSFAAKGAGSLRPAQAGGAKKPAMAGAGAGGGY